jgi:hypothetical protein
VGTGFAQENASDKGLGYFHLKMPYKIKKPAEWRVSFYSLLFRTKLRLHYGQRPELLARPVSAQQILHNRKPRSGSDY